MTGRAQSMPPDGGDGRAGRRLNVGRIALRPEEVAGSLGVDPRTVRRWMRNEGLPFARIGGVVLIPEDELRRWLAERVTTERELDAKIDEILDGF